MQYLLLGLVLAIITASVAAWMKMMGANDGVADADLIDFSDLDVAPVSHEVPVRHAALTVVSRHIPLIAVRRGPRVGQAWLQFADGTELLAEERALGALGFLALDLEMYGPTPTVSITTRTDDCWVSVGRRNTSLRLVDAHHPQALRTT